MSKAETARPAIEERGEFELVLDGRAYVLRPSFEAIAAFETTTGKGLLELTRAALEGKLGIGVTAQVATECIRAWGRETDSSDQAVNAGRIAELMLESDGGFHDALGKVAAMLTLAATGGYTATGKLKPATKTAAVAAG